MCVYVHKPFVCASVTVCMRVLVLMVYLSDLSETGSSVPCCVCQPDWPGSFPSHSGALPYRCELLQAVLCGFRGCRPDLGLDSLPPELSPQPCLT